MPEWSARPSRLWHLAPVIAWRDRRARMAMAFGRRRFCHVVRAGVPVIWPRGTPVPDHGGHPGRVTVRAVVSWRRWPSSRDSAWHICMSRYPGRSLLWRRAAAGGARGSAAGARSTIGRSTASRRFSTNCGRPATTRWSPVSRSRPREAFQNVDCMLASTRFWKPLVNGYSSFMPESYMRSAAALDAFPEGDHAGVPEVSSASPT